MKKELLRLAEQLLPLYVGFMVGAVVIDGLPTDTGWMLGYAVVFVAIATLSQWARQRQLVEHDARLLSRVD